MSLDKQRILSELGSVMNQLQSADCGCMGKLFSNQGQGGQAPMGNPLPTCGGCRRGCCQGHGYGYSMPNAGEPYQANPSMHMNRPCMGHCNPPKLYSDTYNYLNNNLMQPVVHEVYNDLKTLTPQNTIMNNPSMAGKMGLSGNTDMNMAQNKELTGGNMNQMQNMSGVGTGNMGNPMQNMTGMGAGNMHSMPMQQGQQPMMNNMGGMGPEIAKMILGESGAKQSNPQNISGQGGQLQGSMLIDAPQSPHGQVGVTPLNLNAGQTNPNMNQGQYTPNMNRDQYTPNMNQSQYTPNVESFGQNSTMQYMSHPGSAANAQNIQQNPGNAQMGMANPATPQVTAPNQGKYRQHNQGIMKFNEMFPGVMQGGDLGFDPIAIAIQMNPANQKQAAMDTMQKIMNGGHNMNKPGNVIQQAISPTNFAQPQTPMTQGQQYTNQQLVPPAQTLQMPPGQQQIDNTNAAAIPQQQQQVYTAVAGNRQQAYQQSMNSQPQQNQDVIDPNTGALVMPANAGVSDPNTQMQQPPAAQSEALAMQQMIKDPIFPADSSKTQPFHYTKPQKRYDYNTLGQPVQMLPARLFHPTEPGLPQTLSPQPVTTKPRNDPMKYSNVKATESKTSIMGKKSVARGFSKSQLQNIYNQYKGSHSYTEQNLKSPVQAPTHSDGKLNVTQRNVNPQQLLPVEKVGGDTIANNQLITEKVEQVKDQVGDVPASNKPHGDVEPMKAASGIPQRHAKLRNGLQDLVYTSYPTSAAWSFHGVCNSRPMRYGFRNKDINI